MGYAGTKEDIRRKNTEHMRRWRAANRAHENRKARASRLIKRDWILTLKAAMKCQKCGENHPACLDFHHRDPTQKRKAVSLAFYRWKRATVEAEIAKCDILCANCHRKLHWGDSLVVVRRE